MKQPANTVPPLVGEPTARWSLKNLFWPQHRGDACYEARDRRGALYLLWMECVRFGVRMAYPCVLHEEGAEPLVFASGSPSETEQNAALIRRWEELNITDLAGALEITELEKAAFRKKYQTYLHKGSIPRK